MGHRTEKLGAKAHLGGVNKTAITVIGALLAIAAVAMPVLAADADIPVALGQPGFYGRIELGDDAPRPRLDFAQARLVERVATYEDPIYLHVRPGQARDWPRHCREYNACGRHVYFVNDVWYNTVYVPHYRDRGKRDAPVYDDGRLDSARRDEAPLGCRLGLSAEIQRVAQLDVAEHGLLARARAHALAGQRAAVPILVPRQCLQQVGLGREAALGAFTHRAGEMEVRVHV